MYTDASPEFWKFSLNEYMRFDLPNTVDYILGVTGFKKVGRGGTYVFKEF